MPNLPSHVALALQWAQALDHNLPRLGPYLLGATAPDIRAMTKGAREDTHFMGLDSPSLTAGVEGLFAAHPELADASRLNEPTVAFLLGYFSHLIADQGWITTVYRPHFANALLFPDVAEAKVMDRALQLEQDRQSHEMVRMALPFLPGAEAGIEVQFLSAEVLQEWREWTERFLSRDFSWERLRSLAHRRQQEKHAEAADAVAERFLTSVDKGLEQITQRVPVQSVQSYRERAAVSFAQVGREFLRCV